MNEPRAEEAIRIALELDAAVKKLEARQNDLHARVVRLETPIESVVRPWGLSRDEFLAGMEQAERLNEIDGQLRSLERRRFELLVRRDEIARAK